MPRAPIMRSARSVYFRAIRRVERRSRLAIATSCPAHMALLVEACRLANRLYRADAAYETVAA